MMDEVDADIATSRRVAEGRDEDAAVVAAALPHPNDRRGSAPTTLRKARESAEPVVAAAVIRLFSEM